MAHRSKVQSRVKLSIPRGSEKSASYCRSWVQQILATDSAPSSQAALRAPPR
jgi:hypothetical protein